MSEEIIILEVVEEEIVLEVETVNNGPVTGAQVEDQIADGETVKAPSQNAVFDELLLKAQGKTIRILVDGANIATDLQNKQENWSALNTAQAAIARSVSNFADNTFETLFVYKSIAGACTITFSGAGYRFIDLNAAVKAAPAASVAIALSGGAKTCYEFTVKQTGMEDPDTPGSKIVTIAMV